MSTSTYPPTAPNKPVVFSNSSQGIYIHYPFCVQKCGYCDFYSLGVGKYLQESERSILGSYKKELFTRLRFHPELSQKTVDTIFIGGGTPSRFPTEELQELLDTLRNQFPVSPTVEISIEANPEDLNLQLLQEYSRIGINRINVGIQSFSPSQLDFLGRYYDPVQYEQILQWFSRSSIHRYGGDLIYGIPGQNKSEVFADVLRLIQANCSHISLYSLTVELGTNYSIALKENKTLPPLEDLQSELLVALPELLESHGYIHYEVSNFAKPGEFSRHNLGYWSMKQYLALGPGAHGWINSGRYENPRSLVKYQNQWKQEITHRGDYEKKQSFSPIDWRVETGLNLLRLFLPIEIRGFLENMKTKEKSQILEILRKWSDQGDCSWDGEVFQWKRESILHLDQKIYQFAGV